MISVRSLARVLPRSSRFVASPLMKRNLAMHASVSSRSVLRQAPQPIARFSTSTTKYEADGSVNQELAAKLASEVDVELGMSDSENLPQSVKEFLDNSSFEIQDIPGEHEVVLTRQFGDETIQVIFTIEDLNQMDHTNEEDDSLMDDMEDPADLPADTQAGSRRNVNQGRAGNFSQAPEDSIAAADSESDELPDDRNIGFPANVTIKIQRAGKGALEIDAVAEDGIFVIENVSYFKDGSLVLSKSADKEHKSRDLYTGPPFGNLDEELQLLFERYLDERGVNVALAAFIPDYIDFKEQREYLDWLKNVKSFVE